MTKLVTMYENKKNGKKYEFIPEIVVEGKSCLQDVETGEQKFYAESTLKRNFKKSEVEVNVDDTTKNDTEDVLSPEYRANKIVSDLDDERVVVKNTASYIGFSVAKKSVAQLAYTKKRLTVSVNKKEFFGVIECLTDRDDILAIVDKCFYKEAPAKYGWRMDYEIDVTDLPEDEIEVLIKLAISTRS